jgi:DDE_Tnp_1-associated
MQSIASLPVLDDLTDDARAALLTDDTLYSLADVFAALPDPRSRHGMRYGLPFLLTCLVAAFLCGVTSTDAVGQWCRDHRPLLRTLFGPRRHLTPSGSLYRRLLPRLSAATLEWTLAGWVLHTRPRGDRVPTVGGDLDFEISLSIAGALCGVLAATLMTVERDEQTGQIVTQAGVAYATLWVVVFGGRLAFAWAASNLWSHQVMQFSVQHAITGSVAWTAAFVLMALSMVVARTAVVALRALMVNQPLPLPLVNER